jgi:hypothetical protein
MTIWAILLIITVSVYVFSAEAREFWVRIQTPSDRAPTEEDAKKADDTFWIVTVILLFTTGIASFENWF